MIPSLRLLVIPISSAMIAAASAGINPRAAENTGAGPCARPENVEAGPRARPNIPDESCLIEAYSEFIDRIEQDTDAVFVVMKDGARLIFDDGRQKSFEETLNSPDLEDQLALPYPTGPVQGPAPVDFDPGRVRVTEFFKSVFGRTPEEVESNLVSVDWPSLHDTKKIRFNRKAGAAEALSRVALSLKNQGEVSLKAVRNVGGTFNHRTIDGTDRLSAHAFGIAIDIDVKHSAYWRWSKTFPKFINNIPQAIVDIFEKNKFIWGGKWYHFDTMHFEYRPELFCTKL